MRNEVATLSMIPEVADIGDQLAIMPNQDVVEGDHALLRVAGRSITLEHGQTMLIEALGLPIDFGHPAIEAGLIGRLRKLRIDTTDGLALSDQQAGEIFGEVASFWFVTEQMSELCKSFLDDTRMLNDSRHGHAPLISRDRLIPDFSASALEFIHFLHFAKVQLLTHVTQKEMAVSA